MGPIGVLDDLKRKTSWLCRDSSPGSSSLWPSRYIDSEMYKFYLELSVSCKVGLCGRFVAC